jgi:gamma-glutamylcyclotransferase (GGCT)/AIG2-like uncharacterized protein YtfP
MHKVFVYGSLLSGMGNHGLLGDSEKLGISHSPEGFEMIDLGAFPGAIKTGNPDVKIIGEVYKVTDDTLSRLDRLECYNHIDGSKGLYDRLEIDTKFGTAYIYIFNNRYGKPRSTVEDGDWKSYYTRRYTLKR